MKSPARYEQRSEAMILIVEDDRKTASLVATYLEREGFATAMAPDGEEALRIIQSTSVIFIILDLMLPKVDGWDVCRRIRRTCDVPILFLTARDEEMDRVNGFELGADDYVVKPFSPRELVARVKAILRRSRARNETEYLSFGCLTVVPEKHRVLLDNHLITLTLSEFTLLHTLMSNPGRVYTRNELLQTLYPRGEEVIDRVVDVHIGKLRQKLGDDPVSPRYIFTVRGIGYQFADSDHREALTQ